MNQLNDRKMKTYHRLIREKVTIHNYPWRYLKDPYKILVSEFMLHRTQAKQVKPVFECFIEQYPTIDIFCKEDYEIIYSKLSSLGLFWRIEGMYKAISELNRTHGEIPVIFDTLIDVEGIGPYIAGAVVCFSKNKAISLVDTNTVRVVGRIFGLDLSGEARRRKAVKETIKYVTPRKDPRSYYYAIIDLAHDICHGNNPDCETCPLNKICDFYLENNERKNGERNSEN